MSADEAQAWCQALGAVVIEFPHHGGTMYTVRVPGFHPQTAEELSDAVEQLDANLAHCLPWGDRWLVAASAERLRVGREQFLSRKAAA